MASYYLKLYLKAKKVAILRLQQDLLFPAWKAQGDANA